MQINTLLLVNDLNCPGPDFAIKGHMWRIIVPAFPVIAPAKASVLAIMELDTLDSKKTFNFRCELVDQDGTVIHTIGPGQITCELDIPPGEFGIAYPHASIAGARFEKAGVYNLVMFVEDEIVARTRIMLMDASRP